MVADKYGMSDKTTDDVYLILFFGQKNVQWILHLWRDEECVKILKNCHRALPANCRVGMGGRRGCVGDGRMARTRGGRDHRDSTRARPSQRDG
jgi:hypothetical protein